MVMQRLTENQRLDALVNYENEALFSFAFANATTWDGRGVFRQNDEYIVDSVLAYSFSPPTPNVAALEAQVAIDAPPQANGYIAIDWDTGLEADAITAVRQAIATRLLTVLGSVWWRREFGSTLIRNVGRPNDSANQRQIIRKVNAALAADEDWYEVNNISTDVNDSQIIISLEATILQSGESVEAQVQI